MSKVDNTVLVFGNVMIPHGYLERKIPRIYSVQVLYRTLPGPSILNHLSESSIFWRSASPTGPKFGPNPKWAKSKSCFTQAAIRNLSMVIKIKLVSYVLAPVLLRPTLWRTTTRHLVLCESPTCSAKRELDALSWRHAHLIRLFRSLSSTRNRCQ